MEIQEFESALAALGWKQADFCRKAGVMRNTTSRWLHGHTPIPDWVPSYLAAMLAIQELYEQFVRPDKAGSPGDVHGADQGQTNTDGSR